MNDKANPPNLLSDSWTFSVAEDPVISNIRPSDKSEQTALNQISAKVSDNTAVDWAAVKLKINNSYVNALTDPSTGTITYMNNIPSGNYTAVLEAKDLVKAPNGQLNSENITLKVNGKTVNFDYDAVTGKVTYTPTEPLENESYQTVNLTASVSPEISESREWKFYTNNYPDMKDSGYESCSACHKAASFSYSNGVLENVHSTKLTFGGTHSKNKCENCQYYVTIQAGCSQCHEDVNGSYGYAPHGSTPSITYQAKNYDPNFPIRVMANREMNDCIVCHQPGSQVKGYGVNLVTPTRLLNNHDIPELHKTSDDSCTKCHAQSLTHEHARDDRTDKDGNPITCNTCHQSTDTKVIQAIKDKITSCSACHGEASHDELHVYTELSVNCTGCHRNTLTIEHKNREVKCAGCHESEDEVVVNAIETKNKACQACHTKPIHEAQHAQCKECHSNNTLQHDMPTQ